jgi:transposase
MTQIVLDENDFTTLVKGDVVERHGVKVILSDIGFRRMIEVIEIEAIHLYKG